MGIFQKFIKEIHNASQFNELEKKTGGDLTLDNKVQQDSLLNCDDYVQRSLKLVEVQKNVKWIEIDESSNDETNEFNIKNLNRAAIPKPISPMTSQKRKVVTYRSKGNTQAINNKLSKFWKETDKNHAWAINLLATLISNFSKLSF